MDTNEVSEIIEEALNKVLPEVGGYNEHDILSEWIVVAYIDNPEDFEHTGCTTFCSHGAMPRHRARGLLYTALVHFNRDVEPPG